MKISQINPYNSYINSGFNINKNRMGASFPLNITADALGLQSNYNIAFLGQPNAVYAVSNDGSYKRYPSKTAAANAIGITSGGLTSGLYSNNITVGGFALASADDIEIKNNDGTIDLDKKKLIELIKRANYRCVYAINPDGSYKKYQSQKQAAKDLNVTGTAIFQSILKDVYIHGKIAIAKASEIETINEDCTITINENKIAEYTKNLTNPARKNKMQIYLIDENGNYKKYESQAEAAKELGVTYTAIGRVLSGKGNNVKGKIAVNAKDIEKINENEEIEIDNNKINFFANKLRDYINRTPETRAVYIVNPDGTFVKYNSKEIAAAELNVTPGAITKHIKTNGHSIKQKTAVWADEVENSDGVDIKKIQKLADELKLYLDKKNKKI